MPARSVAQRRFMAMVAALKKGKLSPDEVSAKVREAASEISLRSAREYAKTKERKLPYKVKKKK